MQSFMIYFSLFIFSMYEVHTLNFHHSTGINLFNFVMVFDEPNRAKNRDERAKQRKKERRNGVLKYSKKS